MGAGLEGGFAVETEQVIIIGAGSLVFAIILPEVFDN